MFILNEKIITGLGFSLGYSLNLLKNCYPLSIALLSTSILQNCDKLIIGFFVPLETVGIYFTSAAFILLSFAVANMIVNFNFYKLISQNISHKKLTENISRFGKIILIFGIANAITFAVIAPALIDLFFGDRYAESILLIRIMSISIPFGYWYSYRKKFLILYGKEKLVLFYSFVGSLIMYLMANLLAPRFQAQGMAYSFVSSYILSTLIVPFVIKNKDELRIIKYTILGFRNV